MEAIKTVIISVEQQEKYFSLSWNSQPAALQYWTERYSDSNWKYNTAQMYTIGSGRITHSISTTHSISAKENKKIFRKRQYVRL